MTKFPQDAATDDARSTDSHGADDRRKELAQQARNGLRHALSEDGVSTAQRTPTSSALGTPVAEGVEDGEGASPIEIPEAEK